LQSTASTTNIQETTNNVDNRIYNTLTDFGAVDGAISLGQSAIGASEDIVANSLGFGSDAISSALNFGDRAGERVSSAYEDAIANSLGFGSDAVSSALNFGDRANERVASASNDALSFGKSAMATVLDAISGAFDAIGGGTQETLTFADRQNMRVADIADASSERSLNFGTSLLQGASDLIGSAYESAFDTASDVLKDSQANVANTVSNLNAISRQASTSDAERNQSIVKYALGAAVIMVIAFSLRGAK